MSDNLRLVVGLGNPGKEYERTRHNVGFDVVEEFARLNGIAFGRRATRSKCADGVFEDKHVYVIEPQMYMNLSGVAVAEFIRQKPITPDQILLVADDINLPVGKLRMRPGGSDGGHNGLKSIFAHLQTRDIARLRVGVGAPADTAGQVDFVLSKFHPTDREIIDEAIGRAACAIEEWLREGLGAAMNKING